MPKKKKKRLHIIFPERCMSIGTNFPFLVRMESHWIMVHLNDLRVSDDLHKLYFQIPLFIDTEGHDFHILEWIQFSRQHSASHFAEVSQISSSGRVHVICNFWVVVFLIYNSLAVMLSYRYNCKKARFQIIIH